MKRFNIIHTLFSVGLMSMLFTACTTDITIDIPTPEPKIVVEGTIEPGVPPIISLTSTVPFYGEINFNTLDNRKKTLTFSVFVIVDYEK